ncbi:MAG: hypothetical protein KA746_10630 [Pyrinomonadaceae bacterium]|nr:hypothetical protein [Pyrinomonadaceae bacterium]MBP6212253.1 hypothetical protein [Pyrinomonadaceae bacterium]
MRSKRNISFAAALATALFVLFSMPTQMIGQQRATQYGQMKPEPKRLFDNWAIAQNMGEGRTITPRERFEAMPVSRRSTFAAATNALLYTKLTDSAGRPIGFAIDLVAEVEEISGQEPGKGSDEQFRLYVKLKPGAREKLELSREFQHGKNNTVFHKGYPINYRQAGAPPTMQYSIATDEVRADIDVDYRSSGFPAALFNGHLSASNSDVRAQGNYPTHLRRWPGLVDWWETDFPDLVAEFSKMGQTSVPRELLPAKGDANAPEAASVTATADLFFKTWFLDKNTTGAMTFLRERLTFCSDMKESPEKRLLETRKKALFLETLKAANKELKKVRSLENAIRAVAPVDPWIKAVDHFQKTTYTLAVITDGDYDHFVCSSRDSEINAKNTDNRARLYGKHYVTKFQFILENGKGGILRLLWANENGQWKIEAFDAVTA